MVAPKGQIAGLVAIHFESPFCSGPGWSVYGNISVYIYLELELSWGSKC